MLFEQPPESHRTGSFKGDFAITRSCFGDLTGARNCEICLGSGTLANDIIGAQISLLGTRGLVVSNGEPGRRLMDQAQRFRLDFETIEFPWGEPFDYEPIACKLNELAFGRVALGRPIVRLPQVSPERSGGALKMICAGRKIRLCLDAISTIGSQPVDLRGVYLAAGTSGKGLRSSIRGLPLWLINTTHDHHLKQSRVGHRPWQLPGGTGHSLHVSPRICFTRFLRRSVVGGIGCNGLPTWPRSPRCCVMR